MKLVAMSLTALMMTSTALAQNANTTTTTVGAVQPKAASKVSASYLLWAYNDLETLKNTGGNDLYHQIDLGYKLDNGMKVTLIGIMETPVGAAGQASEVEPRYGDLALKLGGKGGSVLGSDPASLSGRVYFKTSSASFKSNREYVLRADAGLNWKITNKLNSKLEVSPRYSEYSTGANKTRNITTAGVTYDLSDKTSAYAVLNHDIWGEGERDMTKNVETLGPEFGVDLSATQNISVTLSVGQDRNILNPTAKGARKNVALFDTKETSYNIIGVATF